MPIPFNCRVPSLLTLVSLLASCVVGGFKGDTLPLDQSLNAASQSANNSNPGTPLVARCELTVTWSTSATGSTASTLNRHSLYNGYRRAGHAIVYDARL